VIYTLSLHDALPICECSFNVEGTGTFKPGENTNPFSGKIGVRQHEKEVRIESLFYSHQQAKILNALFKAHPYEEVAYYINTLDRSEEHTSELQSREK